MNTYYKALVSTCMVGVSALVASGQRVLVLEIPDRKTCGQVVDLLAGFKDDLRAQYDNLREVEQIVREGQMYALAEWVRRPYSGNELPDAMPHDPRGECLRARETWYRGQTSETVIYLERLVTQVQETLDMVQHAVELRITISPEVTIDDLYILMEHLQDGLGAYGAPRCDAHCAIFHPETGFHAYITNP